MFLFTDGSLLGQGKHKFLLLTLTLTLSVFFANEAKAQSQALNGQIEGTVLNKKRARLCRMPSSSLQISKPARPEL